MEKENKKTLVDKVWDLLASVKLAIIIFAALSLTSIVGTVLEQNADPSKNIKVLTKMFGADAAPALYRFFDSLGFMDMYHSWWFVGILLCFAANLIICSIDRLPKILKVARERIRPLPEELFKGFGVRKEAVIKARADKARESVLAAAKGSLGVSFEAVQEPHGYQIFGERGNFTRLGVYVTHFSILVILLGALVGIFFGFKGFLNLPEGKTYSVAFSNVRLTDAEEHDREAILSALQMVGGDLAGAAKQLGLDEAGLRAKMRKYGILPLNFGIRCDDFDVKYYGGTDMPKEYMSWLTVIKDGKEVEHKAISVNDPLHFEGVTFYQSSYGMVPGSGRQGIFRLKVVSREGKSQDFNLPFGGQFTIPGTSMVGKIEDFSPALAIDQAAGRPYTYAEQMNNPAVLISFSDSGGAKTGGWILKRYPETWRLPDGNIVEFIDYWGTQYTGLQVRKDPGVWVVYLGCFAMAVGLYMAFFMSHRRVWIRLVEEKGATRVIVGASANKNKQGLERRVDKFIGAVSAAAEGGK